MKSFGQWINESLSAKEKEALLYLQRIGLMSELDGLTLSLEAVMSDQPEDLTFEVEELGDGFDRYELDHSIGQLLWSDLEGLGALEILSITGNLGDLDYYREEAEEEGNEFDEEEAAAQALESYYDSLAIEASSGRVDRAGKIWLYPRFFDRGGRDQGFNQLVKAEGYPLEEAVPIEEDRVAIMKAVLNLVISEVL